MPGVIIAVIERPEVAARTLAGAERLAQLMGGGARIEVLAIRMPPEATILPSEEVLTRKQELHLREREEARIAGLKSIFDTWSVRVQEEGIATEWADVEGLSDSVVDEWGRRADFIVLKRPAPRDHVPEREAVHAALFDTSRPVLVVPPERPPSRFGRRIAIAWREDKFTIRAVLAALRVLTKAEQVYVLAGAREGAPTPKVPDVLAEHDIDAQLHVLPIGARVFGEALLAKAHLLGADMLVLGSYVHHPARSLVLGGVTRYMLAHADLPVLMRH
jgi:nucleotide-binding universal stress UspA family protein